MSYRGLLRFWKGFFVVVFSLWDDSAGLRAAFEMQIFFLNFKDKAISRNSHKENFRKTREGIVM